MKIDIARQPLVPAFVTLFALAVTAMWGGAGNGVSAGAPETMPLLGGALARFQAAYPVWARLAAGFMILFTGMCTGRIAIRYNLYGVSTCLPIPLYAVVACGIVSGGNYLTAFAASMLLALAAKNYCRSYCNGYGFDAIFRASLYLGLLPLVYAPATPLVLILPLAILLFRRTFREVVAAAAGLILPVLTACYVSWGAGEEFTGSGHGTGRRGRIGRSAMDFHGPSAPVARHALHHCGTRPDGALFLSFGHLCRRNQAAFYPYL